MPSMDLSKLKQPQNQRNYIAVANTSRRLKEKDLLFIDKDFTQLTNTYGGSSRTFKKSVVDKLKRIE